MHKLVVSGVITALVSLCMTGCGGSKPPTPEAQAEIQKQTESSMDKGMDAMKGMKNIKR